MPSDLRSRLQSSLGERYTIERELGGGGMARVFVASERALDRRVVIKVLSPALAAEVSTRRFEREIRLAASLQQANIVPVLSTGETDGVPHYTMPFVEGLSLRERLQRDDPLSLGETVGILRDVARALAYAHDRGVVHRDIKPENVLLSGDAAVVTDFGIAKAIASARQSSGDAPATGESTVTQVGTAVGTPAYMAPEQIACDPGIDHRADLYAFGCLAYEMLAGSPPFASATTHGLFSAHISQQPTPVLEKNPSAPPTLGAMVMRCLEKDPDSRPQSARDILVALDSSTSQSTGIRRFVHRLSRKQRRMLFAGAGIASIVVAAVLWRGVAAQGVAPPLSVVVVPFLNQGGDSANEYLADGMADGLATGLGKVPGITVVSRSLGYRYKGRPVDAREIGGALAVSYVLHGSVRRVGDRLRLSAQLTNARDNLEVWSETYDRGASDAFAVQDEITRLVVSALPRRLTPGASPELPASPIAGTSDPDAFDLYLRGRFLLQRRAVGAAAKMFELAIARDSTFASAHSSLALALELRPYFEPVDARSLGARALAAASRALALDSTLAEAHTARAMAHQHMYQWRDAERSYGRALALNPNEPDAFIQWGRFLFYTGRGTEALAAFERARQLDPLSAVASAWTGHMHRLAGRPQQGLAEIQRAIGLDSNNAPSLTMYHGALLAVGRADEARAVAERFWSAVPAWRAVASKMLIQSGDTARAMRFIRDLETRRDQDPTGNVGLATMYAARGDSVNLFAALERATVKGEIWPTYWSLSDPIFDFVRSSARFATIARSVGLNEQIFTSPSGGRPR